ncbi:protochlorophyllide-dependent translocon component 52 chloroplastic-like, partial [Trifolium medium]|nr:protochlorophyllide-dependent translocon component 52 chloroplastic-like [Trifolium medium]
MEAILAPLSEGRIDQWGRLQCVYHGWCFNGSGHCKFIPQAPRDGPPAMRRKELLQHPSLARSMIKTSWFGRRNGMWQPSVLSTEEGEVWALLQAMSKATYRRYRGFERIQFESVSQVLVEAIRTKRKGNSEFLSIVKDIIIVMTSCPNFEVKFIRRQANLVVHKLARAARFH